MIPKTLHQIWIGGKPIPANYWAWHERLHHLNPNWTIRLWSDNGLRDVGIDVGHMKRQYWSNASASNMIRLKLVEKYGGIYLDMDMEPHQPLDSRIPLVWAFAADQGDGRLCNAAFGAPPNHPWIEWQIRHGAGDCDPHDAAWGVYTMTKAPRAVAFPNDGVYVLKTDIFYPYHYDTPQELRKPTEDTVCEHKWDGSWTKK